MKRVNKWGFVVLVFLISLAPVVGGCRGGGAGSQAPQKVVNWALGSSGSGSSPYLQAGVLCNVANKHAKEVQVSPQVTAGFEENVKLVAERRVELGMATGPQLVKYHQQFPTLRGLFNVSMNPYHLVVRGGLGVQRVEDLKGRTVNIGAPGQATRVFGEKLLKCYGLTPENFKVSSLTTGEAIEALKNDQIDAAFILAGLPMPGLAELAVTKKITLLPIQGPPADAHMAEMGGTVVPVIIPAGTYKGVDVDVPTLGTPITLFCHADLDEKLVYEFVKAVWDNVKELREAHGSFKDAKLDGSVVAGWKSVPLHPGAEKYFKEVGVIK